MSETSNHQFSHENHIKHVIAPDAPTTTGGAPSPEPVEKKKMSLKNKLLIGGAGVALAAVAGAGIGIGVSNNGQKPAEATSSSAPANPSDSPSPSASESTPATPETTFDTAAGFSVEKYTTPEALMTATLDQMQTSWINDGANKKTVDAAYSLSNSLTSEDFAANVAAKTDANYINATFVSDWQSNPNLTSTVNGIIDTHKNNLNLYIITSNYDGSETADVEPYRREAHLISIEKSTKNPDGSWTIVTTENETDNDDKNRADQLTNSPRVDPFETPVRVSYTWVQEGGKWLISDINFLGNAN